MNRRSVNRVTEIPMLCQVRNRIPIAVACIFAAMILNGCANRQSANITPGADLDQVRSIYVVKTVMPRPDKRGINSVIRDTLIAMGYTAYTGTDAKSPRKVDAVVTYLSKWRWDITMYMLELTITMRNPDTEFPMAVGNSYHTSLTRKSTEEMVKEVLSNIFAKSKKPSSKKPSS